VVNWFWRKGSKRKRVEVPRLRPRSELAAATRVDLADLAPHREQFLGQAAYIQLVIFEGLSDVVGSAPTLEAKEGLTEAAAISLEKHHALVAEIRRTGADPTKYMAPYTTGIDFFQRVTTSNDWYENLVTSHITSGILDDFFIKLATGLPNDLAKRVAAIYAVDSHEHLVALQIREAIDADPKLAARLALWGRRLVGDTILVARSALAALPSSANDEARIEPVFTELIAAHTRRMDALGLTA
jgi:hypothetical protein